MPPVAKTRMPASAAQIIVAATVVAPVRDWSMSRPEEISYAEEHGIPVPVTKESPYSVDANLFGRSIEAGPLEDPDHEPTPDVYEMTVEPEDAPDEPRYVELGFQEGLPVSVDGEQSRSLRVTPRDVPAANAEPTNLNVAA